jgi:hypothetical protein
MLNGMNRTRTALALAATSLLLATACADDDAAPTRAADQTTEDVPAEQEPTDTEEETDDLAGATDADLALGDTHNWTDGVSLTITGLPEIDPTTLGEFDTVTEGTTPFRVEMTITNGTDQPLDLSEFTSIVEGATNGGAPDSEYFEGDELLEGRLAPGGTKEHADSYSVNVADLGRDMVVEIWRMHDDMDLDAPTWVGSITQ